jgi:transcriptional regulator with XRE-family HTH domain
MLGTEFRAARLGLGLSQELVAKASRVSRPRYSRIERGKTPTLQVIEVARIATVLGLEPALRLFPGGLPLRDVGQATRLRAFLGRAARPLIVRYEVALPATDRREQRAWDAAIYGNNLRTVVEFELRIHDAQALGRRIALKRRDDPADHFMLVIADTKANRRVLDEIPDLFPELPRVKTSRVLADLEAGRHPGTGLVLA